MTTLTVTTITDEDGLARLAPEWQALDAAQSPRTPFSSPTWCATWWRHFRRASLAVRDEMRVLAVRDAAGSLVAVAPMMLTHRPGRGPVRTRELQFFGADAYVTELRGPVCHPDRAGEALAALAAHLETFSREWDWVQWRGLPAGVGGEAERLGLREPAELVDHYLPVPSSWEQFRGGLSRNIKESLRKCYNSLARDGHAQALRVAATPAEVAPALGRFLDLHRGRSQKTGTVDHLDVFAAPESRRFLADWALGLAGRGEVRVFELMIGEIVVAARIGVVLGDELYLYYSGYDTDWARYSVMTTAVAEAIRWAIENGFRLVNLSTGTDVSKMRWRPRQAVYAGGFQVGKSLRSRAAFAALQALRSRSRARTEAPAAKELVAPQPSGALPA